MDKYVHIKGRLQVLASYVENSELVADIGCDHGRLCVSLLQTGRAKYAIASDISSDSLKKAKILRDKCGLSDKMEVCLADGLQGLQKQPDTIIIAGMGGRLIADIISDSEKIARSANRLVLQPMRGVAQLREFLHENGYHIIKEQLEKEAGRIYQLMCVRYVGEKQSFGKLPEGFYEIGDLMISERDALLPEYLQRLERELQNAIREAEKNGVELSELNKKLDAVKCIQAEIEVEQ